ncbi:MAG: phytanoyl-CoA dioxygenase family protein [Acidobacteriota bacterium]
MGLLKSTPKTTEPPPGWPSDSSLDFDGLLSSNLWIDQPWALRHIWKLRLTGKISGKRARQLKQFVREGYTVLDLDLDPAVYGEMDEAVERLWREKPSDVAYAYSGFLKRLSDGDEAERLPSYRVADFHTYSDAARSLFLQREIFDFLHLVFQEPAVATQSLYFEWGSGQPLHRDPVYVEMKPASHLLAAWIALEDIGPDCGPLVYVPGSHRLPYYQFRTGHHVFDFSSFGDADREAGEAWDREHFEAAGLKVEPLLCKRGQALIWHHSLLHGGSAPRDGNLTRKSFVVHYSTLSTMDEVRNSYLDPTLGEGAPPELMISRTLLEDGECRGYDSPLHAASQAPEGSGD